MEQLDLVAQGAVGPQDPDAAPHDALPEQLGDYRIIGRIGQGGMGTVYEAYHTKLKRHVALKVLTPHLTRDAKSIARFDREMEAVGRVDHPNIVRAMDAREIDGTRILVMEYVAGMNLEEVAVRVDRLNVADACEVVRQVAAGLQCAFQNGLIHRDIKPSNLMVFRVECPASRVPSHAADDDGPSTLDSRHSTPIVKILDLGLALLRASSDGSWGSGETLADGTGLGTVMGTADYMAPEQVTDSHSVDIRADIYSLGCTLYRLLPGQPPFSGPQYQTAFEKMVGHARDTAAPIQSIRADVPDPLAATIERMMAKDRERRFSTPGEVAAALRPFVAGADLGRLCSVLADGTKSQVDTSNQQDRVGTAPGVSHAAEVALAPTAARMPPVSRRPWWQRVVVAAGLLLVLAGGLYVGVITVRIKDKQGKTTADVKVEVPEGGTAEVAKDGQPLTEERNVSHGGQLGTAEKQLRHLPFGPSPHPSPRSTGARELFLGRSVGPPGSTKRANDAPRGDSRPAPEDRVETVPPAMKNAPLSVLGMGESRRIGFREPGSVTTDSQPRFRVARNVVTRDGLGITRLFRCKEDTVMVSERLAEPREVNLWVPVKRALSPCAFASQVADSANVDGEVVVQADRELPDGVYCLHTSEFSDAAARPEFAAPFVVRGWGQPTIVGEPRVEITEDRRRAHCVVTISNEGKGDFNDGFLVVTLQRVKGEFGQFKSRQNRQPESIPAGKTKTVSVPLEIAGLEPGQYYFYGHVNYRHLWDANTLCEFQSPRFSLPASSTSVIGPAQKSP
jgi:serine/threonine protein kinase